MPVDEASRHRMYRSLERTLGKEEAETMMALLPSAGPQDLATKQDLETLRFELRAEMERMARRIIMWTSSMVLAAAGLAFAAGRFV